MESEKLRAVSLFGVSLLVMAVVIVILTPSVNQYEISIYEAYPAPFWLLVIGAMFVGAMVIVGSIFVPEDRSWVFGLLIILLTNILLLLQPIIRGYQMFGRADAMSHLGFVRDILSTGGVDGNIYPPTHVLHMTVTDATGIGPMTVALFVPVVFSVLYFGSMFYILVFLFDDRKQILLALPLTMLPILRHAHVGFRPFDLSVMLTPLLLYLLFKKQQYDSPAVQIPFVVVLFGTLLYHPLTALFLIGVMFIYFVAEHTPYVNKQYRTPTNVLSLSAAIFLVWYSNFTGIILRFESIYETLFGTESGDAPIESYTSAAEEASPPLIDIIRVALFKYGIEFVLFALGFAFIGLMLLLLVSKRYTPDKYIVLLVGTMGVFSIGGLFFLLSDLIVPPERPFQFAKIGAVILAGKLIYLLWVQVDSDRWIPGFSTAFYLTLVVGILLLVSLSTFSMYKSPLGAESNHQVTEMEVDGSRWITEHGSTEIDDLVAFKLSYRRFYQAQYGTGGNPPYSGGTPPDHFNYTENEYLGQSYDSTRYLTITRVGRIVYPQNFPDYRQRWRYTPQDFDRLERDRSTDRIYSNGDYDQYLVSTVGAEP